MHLALLLHLAVIHQFLSWISYDRSGKIYYLIYLPRVLGSWRFVYCITNSFLMHISHHAYEKKLHKDSVIEIYFVRIKSSVVKQCGWLWKGRLWFFMRNCHWLAPGVNPWAYQENMSGNTWRWNVLWGKFKKLFQNQWMWVGELFTTFLNHSRQPRGISEEHFLLRKSWPGDFMLQNYFTAGVNCPLCSQAFYSPPGRPGVNSSAPGASWWHCIKLKAEAAPICQYCANIKSWTWFVDFTVTNGFTCSKTLELT